LEYITHTECICSGSSSGYIIQISRWWWPYNYDR
jgi:hypothetical protein